MQLFHCPSTIPTTRPRYLERSSRHRLYPLSKRLKVSEGDSRRVGTEVGVVIVDHGSRRQTSNAMLFQFVDMYKQVTGREIVYGAHMEIARPNIRDAVKLCAEVGVRHVVVAPYFLSRGRHIQEDIPQLVAEAQEEFGVECTIADPIGVDPLMAQLIDCRINTALNNF